MPDIFARVLSPLGPYPKLLLKGSDSPYCRFTSIGHLPVAHKSSYATESIALYGLDDEVSSKITSANNLRFLSNES
jgi:hypothetical protein